MAQEMPRPGQTVEKETGFQENNILKVVPRSKWNISEPHSEATEDEFITQSMNSLSILSKQHKDDVIKKNGKWFIPKDD